LEVRLIDDSELLDLIGLNVEFYRCLPDKRSIFNYTKLLIDQLLLPGAMAIGLFSSGKLIGFTTGYGETDKVYFFTSFYITPKYRLHVKKLYIEAEEKVRCMGYEQWIAHSTNKEGFNLHNKMGATIITSDSDKTIFIKDL